LGVAYFAPYGVGLGHASRLVMVADQLRGNGINVKFSSFGEAAGYILMKGYKCAKVAPVEFAWSMEGGFSVKNSIANIPIWFTNFTRQVNQETRNMTSYSPDIIVSDSRLSPLVAAKLVRIPSIVILNQVKLLLSPRLRQLAIARLFEGMVGEFLGSMWNMADRVLIPDLPPPYTISAHNVWNIGSAARRLEYIGFTSPKHYVTEGDINKVTSRLGFDRSRPVVFIHVSGPADTRMVLVRIALGAVKKLDPEIQFVISEGRADGETEPKRIGESGWYYEWCPVRDEIFAMSDLLVLRGGHVALSQAIQFGKPVITIPIENHGEQLGNSAKIAELGLGMMLHPKGLKQEQLANAIMEVLVNQKYKNNTTDLQKLTEKLNGIENVVQIIRSYL
jgi:UDP-N-acetylglucosamine--N-acetylmuramyl-(pentapeptide) pyrophosphoryl-undecaprenol N-acetylglucosamine transferase